MKIAVIGTGALGSLFAAKLSTNAEVTMVGTWRDQLSAIQENGLRLISPDGLETKHSVLVLDNLKEALPHQVALIMVKGWQTEVAARQANMLLPADGLALTLQNGLGNLEKLINIAGESRSALGVTSEGAMIHNPGLVRHAGSGLTYLGTTPTTEKRLRALKDLFQGAGFETRIEANLDGLVWGKLAVNAGINPLTALLQVPNGYLLENPIARDLMCRAAEETASVAVAQDIQLPYPSASDRTVEVARATASNRSSMAQDIARGMPTEIEAISGQVVRIGLEFGVQSPVNQALLRLVRELVKTGDWKATVSQLPSELREPFRILAGSGHKA